MLKVEDVKAKLKEKFLGAREDGLNNMALTLALAFDTIESVSEAIEKMEENAVNGSINQYRSAIDKEVGQAIKTRENDIKSKYDLIEKGKKQEPQPPTGGETDAQKAIAEAIAAAIAPLKEQLGAFNAAKQQDARRVILEKELENIPAAFKTSIIDGFNSKSFDDEEAFNAYLQATKDNVAAFTKEMADKGLADFGGKPAGGNKKPDEVSAGVSAFLNAQKPEENKMQGKAI